MCYILFYVVNTDGKRKDRDKEDREQHKQAGYILQEKKWIVEESL